MTANELKIGNLVYFKHCDYDSTIPRKVELVQNPNLLGLEKIAVNQIEFNHVEPIPLTEEWLLNFGFTLCENAAWYEKKIPTLGIVVSCNLHGRFCIEHTDEIVTIRDCCYKVHELQNLYFALVREELTFKLE